MARKEDYLSRSSFGRSVRCHLLSGRLEWDNGTNDEVDPVKTRSVQVKLCDAMCTGNRAPAEKAIKLNPAGEAPVLCGSEATTGPQTNDADVTDEDDCPAHRDVDEQPLQPDRKPPPDSPEQWWHWSAAVEPHHSLTSSIIYSGRPGVSRGRAGSSISQRGRLMNRSHPALHHTPGELPARPQCLHWFLLETP
ncbi:unnamed protein product [Pleuronectes platessa]|uniref:Uncharacterized protein n=1 Tax=Pleuronectes platessa TaxID=8262 RepID=A0A9N7VCH0_PLEPL|nr:unnamed protein product [Pleuronectes platessa]